MDKLILIDAEKCTGCRMCEMVCSIVHEGCSNPARSRINVIKWETHGFYLPMLCQQCEKAPCALACPVDAIGRDESLGRMVVNYDMCIGCKLCVTVCPFGGMSYDAVGHRVIKCDFCDGDPLCVKFCDPGALNYVDANTANLRKKRSSTEKLSALMNKLL
jgi:Fe-S-cluster-containing hydrogenase component 2